MSKPFIEVEGFPELLEKIKKLGDDKSKRVEVLKILRQVAGITVNVARSNAPISKKPHLVSGSRTKKTIRPGALKRSIGTITGKSENPTILVGPRAKGTFDGWYGHFVENDTNIYRNSVKYSVYKYKKQQRKRNTLSRVRGRGKNTTSGVKPGAFFMKRSYEQTKGQVTTESEIKFAAFIQKQIDRLSK